MSLIRGINHQLSYAPTPTKIFQCLSLAAAIVQMTASQVLPSKTLPPVTEKKTRWKLQHFSHPIQNNRFKFSSRRGSNPVEANYIEARANHLAEKASNACICMDRSKEVGALPVSQARLLFVIAGFCKPQ
ncbi:hypothetical protein OWV82_008913 [Melia azedarach]|uniref:Uncharacterized protein n=1 Tax=Melia azedarach TaxID=155640 RepID=A0ACC1YDY3_MELAZ|nr:hypothetical protein OWV82_008913 [Melia azedarach]